MRESAVVSREHGPSRIRSYQVERHSDQGCKNDLALAGAVVPAVDSHHHNHTVVGFGDHTELVMVGTSKPPAAIRNLSVLL